MANALFRRLWLVCATLLTLACSCAQQAEREPTAAETPQSGREMVERMQAALAAGPHAFSLAEMISDDVHRKGRLLVGSTDPASKRFMLTWEGAVPTRVSSDGSSVFATRPDGSVLVSPWGRAGSVLFAQEGGKLVPVVLDPSNFAQYEGELVPATNEGLMGLRLPLPNGGSWQLTVSTTDDLPRRIAFQASVDADAQVLELEPVEADVPLEPAAYRPEPDHGGEPVEFFAGPSIGELAPRASFQLTDGTSVRLEDLRGDAVALDFWATWCVPCRPAMKELEELHQEFGDQGLRVFGLRLYDQGDPESFLEKLGVTYPIGDGAPLAAPFAVDSYGLPALYVLDRQGRVVDIIVGFNPKISPASLKQAVLKALAQR